MATPVTHKSRVAGTGSQADPRSVLLIQKSELIGELAQAMANQFNNIMMAVTGYAELELKKAGSKETKSLERVLTHATQATFLIQKLLDFSRARAASPQPFELDQSLNEINELLRELLGEHTELFLTLGAKSQIIHADRIEVERALFALAVVVRNSMTGGGKMTVSTSVVDLDQAFIGTDAAEPGTFLALAVECHPADARPKRSAKHKNFDQSQTVNLSLAAVRGIVKECSGLARISIDPGAGSSFKLYFPVLAPEAALEQDRTLPRNPAVARTILVVEDDDAVRVPASEFLMMEGFKVLQARTGGEALNVVQQSRSSLDILVTDILMPKMNGHEVAAALREQHPDLKVLYISGDPGRTAPPSGARIPANATLRKPFRLNILRDKIHDLLSE